MSQIYTELEDDGITFNQPTKSFPNYPPVFPNIPVAIAIKNILIFNRVQLFHPAENFRSPECSVFFFAPKKSKHPKLYSKYIT